MGENRSFPVSSHGRSVQFTLNDSHDHIERHLLLSRRFYEEDLLNKIYELRLPGMAMVDAGANIGNHSLFFAGVCGGTVYAFEPNPASYARLEANIAANVLSGEIHAHQVALGAKSAKATMVAAPDDNLGMARVKVSAKGSVVVKALDAFEFDERIGFLKIDVEGFECEVLKGAQATIKQHQPHIFAEAHDDKAFSNLEKALGKLGYTPKARYCFTPTYWFAPAA